jgi:deazaflavin-dependent oxidoreductase (nitroreductase family)
VPRSSRLRRFVSGYVNPLTGWLNGRLPGFAFVTYRGRRTGKTYRIPIKVFRNDGDYVVAVMYGPDTEWIRNVMAAGRAEIREGRQTVVVSDPRLVSDATLSILPAYIRPFMRALRVTEFVRLTPVRPRDPAGSSA